ncbi:MAG: magnesium transporter [Pseudohongiellaceae bacterium]
MVRGTAARLSPPANPFSSSIPSRSESQSPALQHAQRAQKTRGKMQSVLFDPKNNSTQFGGNELLAAWKEQTDTFIWIDLLGYEESEERSILEGLDLHELAIQDALRKRHPPKLESYSEHEFLMLRDLEETENSLELQFFPLSLFIKERILITRHRKKSESTEWLARKLGKNSELLAEGAAALALQLANHLSRRYVKILIEFEPRMDGLETEMFDKPNDDLLSEITKLKSRLRYFKRNTNYHKLIAVILKEEPPARFHQALSHQIVDFYEQVERSQSLASLYYDVLTDLSDGYLALSSHRLNKVMQILTVITVIFVPLTFVAGLYGMNFEYIPELGFKGGYFVVLGFMAVAAIIQLILFRRKGWL